MNPNESECDLLRAKIQDLEHDLRRERELAASLRAERDRLRHFIFPPLSDEELNDLLSGVREQGLLGPDTAQRELEAILHDDERQ